MVLRSGERKQDESSLLDEKRKINLELIPPIKKDKLKIAIICNRLHLME